MLLLHAAQYAAPVDHGSISYLQAIILGLIQGVTELFPVSSLGHTVILPQLFGWHRLVVAESQPESFWLPFVVGLHVGTAIGLLIFYWRTWVDIVRELIVRGKDVFVDLKMYDIGATVEAAQVSLFGRFQGFAVVDQPPDPAGVLRSCWRRRSSSVPASSSCRT